MGILCDVRAKIFMGNFWEFLLEYVIVSCIMVVSQWGKILLLYMVDGRKNRLADFNISTNLLLLLYNYAQVLLFR